MKRVLVALLATVVALALGEGGARTWLATRGESWSAEGAERRANELLAEATGVIATELEEGFEARPQRATARFQIHPYYGYETEMGLASQERIVDYFAGGMAEDELSVLVLGGSVAAHFYGPKEGVRELFEERLAADPRAGGRRVRLFGHARPGFKQPQQLHVLAELLRQGCTPDVVVNLDGYNELEFAVVNETNALPADWPAVGHWAHLASGGLAPEALERLVEVRELQRRAEGIAARVASWRRWSAVLGRHELKRLEAACSDVHAASSTYTELRLAATKKVKVDRQPEVDRAVDGWRRASLVMHALCEASGAVYVHALQPTLHDRGSKPVAPAEEERGIRGGWKEDIVYGYPLLRAAGERLAADGVRFVDLSGAFAEVEEALYYDPCHFRRPGNVILAERLADAVLAGL
ncbi:MAG: hypothetical protein AAF682_23420 [Planctomycetota bacterium]